MILTSPSIKINISTQTLSFFIDDILQIEYLISSAAKGVGEVVGSEQTPRGWHVIRAKIGDDCPENTVFVERRPTGEIYSPELYKISPHRDWILTRILWLSGLELKKNRLGRVDTMRRYIYIHGTRDDVEMGKPGSRGCIRMRNADILELYQRVSVGTRVFIYE